MLRNKSSGNEEDVIPLRELLDIDVNVTPVLGPLPLCP
jgi:hypothetical protein